MFIQPTTSAALPDGGDDEQIHSVSETNPKEDSSEEEDGDENMQDEEEDAQVQIPKDENEQ